jgi:hypothetical protein
VRNPEADHRKERVSLRVPVPQMKLDHPINLTSPIINPTSPERARVAPHDEYGRLQAAWYKGIPDVAAGHTG